MKRMYSLLGLGALALTLALPAQAGCFADYKAKRDSPLKLHYGVIELPDAACGSVAGAEAEIAARIAPDGWTLLNVLSIFDVTGLDDKKRVESAGNFFLRY